MKYKEAKLVDEALQDLLRRCGGNWSKVAAVCYAANFASAVFAAIIGEQDMASILDDGERYLAIVRSESREWAQELGIVAPSEAVDAMHKSILENFKPNVTH
jgi:hypothetical protein